MEIHLQTTDHVVAVEKVAAQHIGTKYSKCNSLEVISYIIILGKVLLLTQMYAKGHQIQYNRILFYCPVGQKFTRNCSISYGLRDISDFSHFH